MGWKFPEAEREGGNAVLRRAASLLAADEPSYGLAVYPEWSSCERLAMGGSGLTCLPVRSFMQ